VNKTGNNAMHATSITITRDAFDGTFRNSQIHDCSTLLDVEMLARVDDMVPKIMIPLKPFSSG
jgi:hypothetical protein